MINFIGLNDILNEMDINNITKWIDWDTLATNHINTFRSKRHSNRTSSSQSICQMKQYFGDSTIKIINQAIKKKNYPMILLKQLNRTCPFPEFVFEREQTDSKT